jgi:UDP-N-acetylmuramyl pentapeptide phosphotransferase/UDP-N-acetylglucosamine-1-phosphate transferase
MPIVVFGLLDRAMNVGSGFNFAILAAVFAAVFSFVAIPALLPFLRRHAVAKVNARSSHKVPTPQGAGIALVAGVVGVFATAIIFAPFLTMSDRMALAALGAGAVLISAIGFLDDVRPLPVLPRVGGQLALIGLMLYVTPSYISLFDGALPLVVERLLAAVALFWMVNLTNFIDGLDWLTVAQFVPVAVVLVVLSAFAMPTPLVAVIMAPILGGLIGFAPYNKPVAKLFLGDTGSLVIGLVGGYALYRVAADVSFFAAIIIPLYAISDTSITLVRRLLKGEKIWTPHRSFFFQRATSMGWSVYQVVGTVAALNIYLAFWGWVAAHAVSNSVTMIAFMMSLGAVLVTLRAFTRVPAEALAVSNL